MTDTSSGGNKIVLAYAITLLAVAFNLRPLISAVSPLLPDITADLQLSKAAAGASVTIPVLCFGIFSFVVPKLLTRIKPESLMTICLGFLALGGVARSFATGSWTFFLATFVIGVAIAISNVLVPLLIRVKYARQVALLIGLYSVMLSLGPVIAVAVSRPLAEVPAGDFLTGWRFSTGFWALIAVVVLLAWIPVTIAASKWLPLVPANAKPIAPLLKNPTAWRCAAVMGLQSFGFYSVLTWLPTMLNERSIELSTGGNLLALISIAAIPVSLITPSFLGTRYGTWVLFGTQGIYLFGLALITSGSLFTLSVAAIFIGIGQGAGLAISLHLMSNALDVRWTAAMSAFVQGVGYLFASLGPSGLGAARTMTNGWTVPIVMIAVCVIGLTVAALPVIQNLKEPR